MTPRLDYRPIREKRDRREALWADLLRRVREAREAALGRAPERNEEPAWTA